MAFGLLLIFVPIGFVIIALNENNSPAKNLIYVFILTTLLVWFDTTYAIHIVLPILALLSILGIKEVITFLINKTGKREAILFGSTVLILSSIFIPEFVVAEVKEGPIPGELSAGGGDLGYDKDSEKVSAENLGIYINAQSPHPFIHSIVGGSYISAFSGTTASGSEIYIPAYSFKDTWETNSINKLLTGEFDQLFSESGPEGFNLQYKILLSNYDKNSPVVENELKKLAGLENDVFLIITYPPQSTYTEEGGEIYSSKFLESVQDETYVLYFSDYHKVNYLTYV